MPCNVICVPDGPKLVFFDCNLRNFQDNRFDEQSLVDNYAGLEEYEKRKTVEIIAKMQMDGVNVILCSAKIDAFCLEKIQEYGMVAIENVAKDFLKCIFGQKNGPKTLMRNINDYEKSSIWDGFNITRKSVFDTNFLCFEKPKEMCVSKSKNCFCSFGNRNLSLFQN